MIVVDVGCYSHPDHQGASQNSAERLVGRWQPRVYFGFDPHPDQGEGVDSVGANDETVRVFRRLAAWSFDGQVPYDPHPDRPLHARCEGGPRSAPVRCFDLAAWLTALPFTRTRIVLKVDAEGAEYVLLPRLIDTGLDEHLLALLVEWHEEPAHGRPGARDRLLGALRCPVEEWES